MEKGFRHRKLLSPEVSRLCKFLYPRMLTVSHRILIDGCACRTNVKGVLGGRAGHGGGLLIPDIQLVNLSCHLPIANR